MYLNNAATSFPKPAAVVDAMRRCLEAPPLEAGRVVGGGEGPVERCRRSLATLFDVEDPKRVVLLASATQALNLAISGLAAATGRGVVVTSSLEHNSVLRPLAHLCRSRRFDLNVLDPDADGRLDPAAFRAALGLGAAFAVVTCASNVSGAVQPVEAFAAAAAEAGVPLVLDAAQSAGAIPLSHRSLPGRVFVAFAGHKGLLGPGGTGGLVVADGELPQQLFGGTGIRSESRTHPTELPLRHEAGTPNLPGLAGLEAGVAFVARETVAALGAHRAALVAEARAALSAAPALTLLPLPDADGRAGIVAFNHAARSADEVGYSLHEIFGIEVRAGLHCAPLAHRALGSRPDGCVRVSFGPYNTSADVAKLVDALTALARAA